MHLCELGHSSIFVRLHPRQSSLSSLITTEFSERGPCKWELVGPNIAAVFTPSIHEICIGPVSLVTNASHFFRSAPMYLISTSGIRTEKDLIDCFNLSAIFFSSLLPQKMSMS